MITSIFVVHELEDGRVFVTVNVPRRFVKLVNGEIVATAQQPDVLRSLSSFSAPIADARGRLYFDLRNIDMGPRRLPRA